MKSIYHKVGKDIELSIVKNNKGGYEVGFHLKDVGYLGKIKLWR